MTGSRTVSDYGLSPARPLYLVRQQLCCARGHALRPKALEGALCAACSFP